MKKDRKKDQLGKGKNPSWTGDSTGAAPPDWKAAERERGGAEPGREEGERPWEKNPQDEEPGEAP